ncbi:hypothetical protein L195_g010145 [Trifolium pratense]|uniref:Uncharacterized protein n=1 Tax=Trifolium pratense TaxID=57577 RepID=A0A2K3PDX4_TRIPR|nr:hypothetical protein L195_g010145 [Trifolium pratense]
MNKEKDQSLTTKDSKVQRPLGRGRIKKPAFKPPRTRILHPMRAKDKEVETIVLSSDSSGSDDTDSDYAEFLSTWEPDDEQFSGSLSPKRILRYLSIPILTQRRKELRTRINPKWFSYNIQPFLYFLESFLNDWL